MTVREAFGKAYGVVREEASCHIGVERGGRDGQYVCAALYWRNSVLTYQRPANQWEISLVSYDVVGPDISERNAWEFRGLFGSAYDRVVVEAQDE